MVEAKQVFDTINIPKDQTDEFITRQQPLAVRRRVTLYVKENSVTHSVSSYMMGRRRDNGKVFARWDKGRMFVIRRTSSGRFAFMTREGDKVYGGIRHYSVPSTFSYDDDFVAAWKSAVANLGASTMGDVYPALRHFQKFSGSDFDGLAMSHILNGIEEQARKDTGWRTNFLSFAVKGRQKQSTADRKVSRMVYGALHNDDPRQMIHLLTGQPYRKDIARAMRDVPLEGIMHGVNMQGIEPDMVARILNRENIYERPNYKRRRELYRLFDAGNISRHTLNRLMDAPMTCGHHTVYDLHRMLNAQMTKAEARAFMRNRDIDDAHDELATQAAIRKNAKFVKPIEYNNVISRVNGAKVKNNDLDVEYTIRLAKDGVEIQKWGTQQGHCIGSYATDSYERGAILAGVFEGDKMVANFHLDVAVGADPDKTIYRMRQIYAKYNQKFISAMEIHDFLVAAGVMLPSPNAGGLPRKTVSYDPVEWGGFEEFRNVGYANVNNIQMGEIRADRIQANAIAGMQPGDNLILYGAANLRPVQREAPIF